jgi:5-methylcytosine-specific restriction protein A
MREDYHLGITLTTNEWIVVLQDKTLTNDLDISILQTMYSFEGHKASASQIGRILGFKGENFSSPINAEIGRFGKRVVTKYPIRFTKRDDGTERKWDIFFDGWSDKSRFIWQLKAELRYALIQTGLTGELQLAEEIPIEEIEILFEGAKRTITINSYERNSKAKQLCKENYGTTCQVCDFDFELKYGKIGRNFIHVHHLTMVSDIGQNYEVNPISDLRPVCPNCHAMLHKQNPPLTIEELKKIIEENANR